MKNRDLRITKKSRRGMNYYLPVFEIKYGLNNLYKQSQELETLYNSVSESDEDKVYASKLQACAVINSAYQYVIESFNSAENSDIFSRIAVLAEKNQSCMDVLKFFESVFPSMLEDLKNDMEENTRSFFLYQVYSANPAFLKAMKGMIVQKDLKFPEGLKALKSLTGAMIPDNSGINDDESLFMFLIKPAVLFPDSLEEQIKYILENWRTYLSEELIMLMKGTLDVLHEYRYNPVFGGGEPEVHLPDFSEMTDIESFSQDLQWMPNVVMMAKSTLVWLDQLSKKYQRDIHTLDAIPDEELNFLKENGFTALWLIGLWERSHASKRIKNLCGNPEAEASAYSLKNYNIAESIGGWEALENLRRRCAERGIRLASDMVPNHTGIDGDWVYAHPDYYISQNWSPFPSYSYNGEDLSQNPDFEVKIEDHYLNRTDAAVTFRLTDKRTGQVRYVFHGNDGTSMPWNDTAQLDFLNPQTREAVIQQILQIARNFHIIRFDAAMTLAKKHIQRLWYPQPGFGGDIAGRAVHGMSNEEFNKRIPQEFWREVVERIQAEVPDTLLLAEAFWMMEGYFVRTLGMHRVYNSAFMHMTKNQDNKKYRDSVKSVLVYDPEILKRYVNFMNNPDEETAAQQFGDGDKYFGVCTLLATMPGLPMFGHGQIEGFKEKYGMEYRRAYWDEKPDQRLLEEHKRRIFPLLRMRYLFSECKNFNLFDVIGNNGVEESIYAYVNGRDGKFAIVLYNNRYERAEGYIKQSVPKLDKSDRTVKTVSLAESLSLSVSGRHYVIMKNFSDSLYYIYPSLKLYEEGLFVSLNGYESRIFTDIYEVEDIDGIYSELYSSLNGRGIENLRENINFMLLRPFFKTTAPLRTPKFYKLIKSLLTAKNTTAEQYEILKILGSFYAYTDSISSTFESMGIKSRSVKPIQIIDFFNRLTELKKIKIFSHANLLYEDDIIRAICAYFILLPFTGKKSSAVKCQDILDLADRLSLSTLFDKNQHAVRCSCLFFSEKELIMSELLKEKFFMSLIGYNVYEGVIWYKEEFFTLALYLTILSNAIRETDVSGKVSTDKKTAIKKPVVSAKYEKQLKYWMDRNTNSGYRYLNLIED